MLNNYNKLDARSQYRFQYHLTGTGKELICLKPNMAHYERTSVILIELAKVQNLI